MISTLGDGPLIAQEPMSLQVAGSFAGNSFTFFAKSAEKLPVSRQEAFAGESGGRVVKAYVSGSHKISSLAVWCGRPPRSAR